ncbi:pyridoxal phosphate-dependent aminotransferase [Desulfohalobiaceae bacterium Ax17]|uniref:pyridoxal phosphate-dependent aminotransferase n=1 Tax=Desulfovulcanus ferrireducens TaxID=2831190 RepID=UPI00207B9C49|nr:pyridoxal phosphate-dependent aminotransferase [Desulfovulcanus ferrireducens]MBT8764237.1 pyridoxal phosphate-dependent aminotransferase [Desulfovulcanus ferrireducens]
MQVLSKQVEAYLEKSSWIRQMFEKGRELKQKYGPENVFDFSLGNPDLPPPQEVAQGLKELAEQVSKPFALGYMPNAGLPELRQALAKYLSQEQKVELEEQDIIVTCGAAGGLNALFRAILEPGDEVVCPAPYFVEYGFYVQNFKGILKTVPCKPLTFELDLDGLEAAIGPKVRAVLINSPNNPTGQVYSEEELKALVDILKAKSRQFGRPILLVSDEPYRFLTYDQVQVPSILSLYADSVIVSSFSKSLALAGERVGYIAVCPQMEQKEDLLAGLVLTNRILGYVNAPVIGQYLILKSLGSLVDTEKYVLRRKVMAEVLSNAGLEFSLPRGGFYFFPKAPHEKDHEFVRILIEEKVLAVPGSGFGYPGYVRFAFCVDDNIIARSADAIRTAVEKALKA